MRPFNIRMMSMILAIALLSVSVAKAGQKDEAALAKAPAVIQAAAKKVLGDNKLEEFDKAKVGGSIVYEIGCKIDQIEHTYVFSEKGRLIEEQVEVDASELSPAITSAVKKAHPDGKIDEAAIVTAGDRKFYEVDVIVGKDIHAIQVSLEGKLLSDEIEKSLLELEDKGGKDD
jgi:uncharacterized membrane protein YkoI